MKVLTKHVVIENEEFVLIQDTHKESGRIYYGTIPYTELDNEGKMKRALDGFEICINFENPTAAINDRIRRIKQQKLLNEYLVQGMDKHMAIILSVLNTNEVEVSK